MMFLERTPVNGLTFKDICNDEIESVAGGHF